MTVEALWVVTFGDVANGNQPPRNGGVVVLETGRVFGGDSSYAYVGTFEAENGKIIGAAKILRHNNDPNFIDVWGVGDNEFTIQFNVEVSQDEQSMKGFMEAYGRPLPISFKRLAELPG